MGALLLVHGVGHGSWCWRRTTSVLVESGHDVSAVDLPLTGLDDDAAAVQATLDDRGRDVVLVGHSYAGLVISRAAAGRHDVQHLVYVAAMMVDGGDVYLERMSEFPAAPINTRVELTADGRFVVPPETAVECFYNERDKAIHPDLQRWMSTRAGEVVTLDTDHSPFMSSPARFVDLLDDIASRADAVGEAR